MISWAVFAASEPELAAFGAGRLGAAPAYLATVKHTGAPRVHPVTPVLSPVGLYLFMEPTSPKRHDLIDRHWFALHSAVPDNLGTGGEFFVSGHARLAESAADRAAATEACTYPVAERYLLFELLLAEARANGYGDVVLPERRHWTAPA
jgi:hypothetical protein